MLHMLIVLHTITHILIHYKKELCTYTLQSGYSIILSDGLTTGSYAADTGLNQDASVMHGLSLASVYIFMELFMINFKKETFIWAVYVFMFPLQFHV